MCLAGKICVSYNVLFATVATYIFIPFPTDLFLGGSDVLSLLKNESLKRMCSKSCSCWISRNSRNLLEILEKYLATSGSYGMFADP